MHSRALSSSQQGRAAAATSAAHHPSWSVEDGDGGNSVDELRTPQQQQQRSLLGSAQQQQRQQQQQQNSSSMQQVSSSDDEDHKEMADDVDDAGDRGAPLSPLPSRAAGCLSPREIVVPEDKANDSTWWTHKLSVAKDRLAAIMAEEAQQIEEARAKREQIAANTGLARRNAREAIAGQALSRRLRKLDTLHSKETTAEMEHLSEQLDAAQDGLFSAADAAAEQSEAAEAELDALLSSIADEKAEQALFDRGEGLGSLEDCLRAAIPAQQLEDGGGIDEIVRHAHKSKQSEEEKAEELSQSQQMEVDTPAGSAAPAASASSSSRRSRSSRRSGVGSSFASMSIEDEKVPEAAAAGAKIRSKRG